MSYDKFIVLEGIDGSGKTTQFNLLIKRLKKNNISLKTLDFPQYLKPSSYFIKQYLGGKYGNLNEVGAYKTSIFYALDRFDISLNIKNWLKQGYFILSNRYTASNLGHQGSKIKNFNQRKKFFNWLLDFEHNLLEIPKPTLNIVLHLPANIALKLILERNKKQKRHLKKDIHELNFNYLKQSEKVYLELKKIYPNDFEIVECFKNNKILSVEEIHSNIWKIVKNLLKIKNG
jgi:dTMP kinase